MGGGIEGIWKEMTSFLFLKECQYLRMTPNG